MKKIAHVAMLTDLTIAFQVFNENDVGANHGAPNSAMEQHMVDHGMKEEGEALGLALDCWLRSSETFGLRAEDVVILEEEGKGPLALIAAILLQ